MYYGNTSSTMKLSVIKPRPSSEKPVHNHLSYGTAVFYKSSLPLWPVKPETLFIYFTFHVVNIFSSALLWRHMKYIYIYIYREVCGRKRLWPISGIFSRNSHDYKKIHETFESDFSVRSQDSKRRYPKCISDHLSPCQHSRNEIFYYKTSVMAMKFTLHCEINDQSYFPLFAREL
jgi:hypothetical protein